MHPTRLSKIFAASRTHPSGNARGGRPRNLDALRRKIAQRKAKFENFLKRTYQEGRIPLPAVARQEFCYHSLCEDLNLYTARNERTQTRAPFAQKPSKSATPLEYQNRYRCARPFRDFLFKIWSSPATEQPSRLITIAYSRRVKSR